MIAYATSPGEAYEKAGSPRGPLRVVTFVGECRCCGGSLAAYSQAGRREVGISGLCEPCFDFVTTPSDERDIIDQTWMRHVATRREDADEQRSE